MSTQVSPASGASDKVATTVSPDQFAPRPLSAAAGDLPQWDLLGRLRRDINARGGVICCHAHLDKAYVVSEETLHVADDHMELKWETWVNVKKSYTEESLMARIMLALENFERQGCKYVRTFIDIDRTVGLKCIRAAAKAREIMKERGVTVHLVSQVLEGLADGESRKWVTRALPYLDILGALPSRDRPYQAEHLDWVFTVAKRHGLMVDVHIDQNNDPDERDTELLARKTIEHGMHGRVVAVHACSLAAHRDDYIDKVCKLLKEAEITVCICPRAMLDGVQMRQKSAPVHNSIAPFEFFLKHDVPSCLGVDNVHDFFCPFADGDVFTELMFLLETTRVYKWDALVDAATTNGSVLRDKVIELREKHGPVVLTAEERAAADMDDESSW